MIAPAHLAHVWLARTRFRENPGFDTDLLPLTYQLKQSTEVESVVQHEDEQGGGGTAATVRLDLTVEWYRNDEPADPPFSLAVSVGGHFAWADTTEERLARRWLNYHAVYLLWPYARAYVSSLTSWGRMGTPLTIYTQEIPELPDFDTDEDASATSRHPLASAE